MVGDDAKRDHEARMRVELGGDVMTQRAAVMADGGTLARAMRANEARAWPGQWLRELWLWVLWLRVVRGLRGETTVAAYAGILGRFRDWIVEQAVDYADISLAQLDDWQKSLYVTRRNEGATRRQQIQALRSFYDWRSTRGLGRNCMDGLVGPRKIKRSPKKYTSAQLRSLFDAAKRNRSPLTARRNRLLLLFLLATGLRREEAATLRIEQLELSENRGVVHVFGKGSKERVVPVEGPVVRELIAWLHERSELDGVTTDCVFITTRRNWFGKPMRPQAIERAVQCVAKSAGLPTWGVHRFRVTYATQLYDDGADIERIRIVLGHETIETTRRYLAVSQRMRDVRLKPHRQHDALGTRPVGFPRWAQRMQGAANGGDA